MFVYRTIQNVNNTDTRHDVCQVDIELIRLMVSQGQITWARMVRADTFYEELGTAIRLRREGLKMTQLDLSERMGLSRTSVTNIERGRQRLLIDQFCKLADILRCNHDDLLAGAISGKRPKRAANADLNSMPTVAKFVEKTLDAGKAARS